MTNTAPNDVLSFSIPSCNVDALEDRLQKLAKKAAKLGCSVEWQWAETETVRRVRDFDTDRVKVYVERDIAVCTDRPCLAGWEFLGTLDFTTIHGTTIRRMVPGVECPEYAVNVKPGQCDHCNAVRARTETFVVRHEDGTVKVVGRQCVSDFLGGESAANVAGMLSFIYSVTGACDEESGFGGGRRSDVLGDVLDCLAFAYGVCRVGGGYRPSKFEETSTRSEYMKLAFPFSDEDKKAAHDFSVTLGDVERAWSALTWLATEKATSDFIFNIQAVASAPYVSEKNLGYLCAIIAAHNRVLGQAAERAVKTANPSVHIGTIGARAELGVGLIERSVFFDNDYGGAYFITIRLESGAVLSWKSSRGLAINDEAGVKVGDRVSVKATIKDHTEYRGVAQTNITRAVLTAVP